MSNILLFCDTPISCSNIDIRIVTKNIAVHWCTRVSLQPYYKYPHLSQPGTLPIANAYFKTFSLIIKCMTSEVQQPVTPLWGDKLCLLITKYKIILFISDGLTPSSGCTLQSYNEKKNTVQKVTRIEKCTSTWQQGCDLWTKQKSQKNHTLQRVDTIAAMISGEQSNMISFLCRSAEKKIKKEITINLWRMLILQLLGLLKI